MLLPVLLLLLAFAFMHAEDTFKTIWLFFCLFRGPPSIALGASPRPTQQQQQQQLSSSSSRQLEILVAFVCCGHNGEKEEERGRSNARC